MGSFLKKALILGRLTNVSHHFVSDELNGLRELGDVMQRILPPLGINHQKHLTQCENANSLTIVMPPAQLHVNFKKVQNLLKLSKHPNGTNGDENSDSSSSSAPSQSDARAQRDEEIRKLQDLRQKAIDHNFNTESIMQTFKDADKLLGSKFGRSEKKDDDDKNK